MVGGMGPGAMPPPGKSGPDFKETESDKAKKEDKNGHMHGFPIICNFQLMFLSNESNRPMHGHNGTEV